MVPPPLMAMTPVAVNPTQYRALKVGLVATMVVVCMGVGWLAVSISRDSGGKRARSRPVPAESVAQNELPTMPPAPAGTPLTYERHILPIVERSCLTCHSRAKKRGGLDLSSYAALMKGGEGGPAVQPGNPAESALLETILAGKMPPSGKKVPEQDVRMIREWIQAGARSER